MRLIASVIALVLAGGSLAYAQQAPISTPPTSSQLMLSWRSNGFAPAGYPGRVAASGGGTVLVIAEELVSGRPADVSRYEIRWYLNDELYETGFGLQAVTIPVSRDHQDGFDIRVEIIGSSFSENLKTISVPLTDPLTVIEPQTGRQLEAGMNTFGAQGYSFNVANASDLLYNWTVNGQAPQATEDPRHLDIKLDAPPQTPVALGLRISHPQNISETATALIQAR